MRIFPIILILVLSQSLIWSQTGNEKLPVEGVEVIKNFDARLQDASKINLKPEIPPFDQNARKYQYKVTPASLNISYPDPVIKPLAMKREALPKNYNGQLTLGVGTPGLKYLDFGYKFIDKEQLTAGITAYHNSASKGEFKKYADNDFGLFAKYAINENNAVSGKVKYVLNDINFYGLSQDSLNPFTEEDIDRKYHLIDIDLGFENRSSDLSSGFDISLLPYRLHLSDITSTELGIAADANFYRKLTDKIRFFTHVDASHSGYKDNGLTRSLGAYSFAPGIGISGSKVSVDLGARLASAEGEYSFFPEIEANISLVEGKFIFFAGATGNYHPNTIKNVYTYNPFIDGLVDTLQFTREHHFYGGLKGQLNQISYYGELGYKKTDNHLLYLTDHTDFKNPLRLIYDDLNIFYVNGAVEINLNDNFVVKGVITQSFYSTDQQLEAWHLPNMELKAGVDFYALERKLKLSGDLHFASSARYLDDGGNEERLNNLFELNLGARYSLLSRLDVFLKANNVFDNKYERWYNYPGFGLGIMGGAKIKI